MNPRIHTSLRRSLLTATILAFVTASHAAVVTWGAATNISGDTDVAVNGALVGAVGLSPGSGNYGTTVNGVAFTGVDPFNGNSSSGMFQFPGINVGSSSSVSTSLSPGYRRLLTTVSLAPFTLTISGLTVGASYEFQVWSSFSGGLGVTRVTAGNTVLLSINTGGPDGLGQFAIGTFVADLVTQGITFGGTVNAFQLRNLSVAAPVPEPGSALAGMLALGACASGLLGRRRRG